MRTFQLMFLTAALTVPACFYDPDLSKISEADAEGEETGTTDVEDGGDSENAFTGIGIECDAESDDCDGYDADYCMIDPTTPDAPGRCTISDCDARGCPDTYQCCDCSGVDMEIICVHDDYASSISPYCPCS